jgi:hypothetical protein
MYWFLVMQRELGARRGEVGILASEAPYQTVVATQFADLWATI